MSIKEALVRQDDQDKVLIGSIVSKTLNGRFGEVFRAYINGMITKEMTYHQSNPNGAQPLSSDRILGRCEAYNNCLLGLEQMVEESKDLSRPVIEEEEED